MPSYAAARENVPTDVRTPVFSVNKANAEHVHATYRRSNRHRRAVRGNVQAEPAQRIRLPDWRVRGDTKTLTSSPDKNRPIGRSVHKRAGTPGPRSATGLRCQSIGPRLPDRQPIPVRPARRAQAGLTRERLGRQLESTSVAASASCNGVWGSVPRQPTSRVLSRVTGCCQR